MAKSRLRWIRRQLDVLNEIGNAKTKSLFLRVHALGAGAVTFDLRSTNHHNGRGYKWQC